MLIVHTIKLIILSALKTSGDLCHQPLQCSLSSQDILCSSSKVIINYADGFGKEYDSMMDVAVWCEYLLVCLLKGQIEYICKLTTLAGAFV